MKKVRKALLEANEDTGQIMARLEARGSELVAAQSSCRELEERLSNAELKAELAEKTLQTERSESQLQRQQLTASVEKLQAKLEVHPCQILFGQGD